MRLVGARSDVMELLPLMRVVVMPSVSEGLPLALLEAMSSSRAIVATEVGGIPMALAHGAAGLLVPPADPSALADAIITLLTDDERSRAFGLVARQRYDEQFTARAIGVMAAHLGNASLAAAYAAAASGWPLWGYSATTSRASAGFSVVKVLPEAAPEYWPAMKLA